MTRTESKDLEKLDKGNIKYLRLLLGMAILQERRPLVYVVCHSCGLK